MDLFRRNTKPPPAGAAAKGQFKPKSLVQLEQVRAKLAAVNDEVARLEADADKIALAAALDDNPSTGFAAISSLQEARARRDMLQRAEVAALANENARLADLHSKADKARSRALSQKLGEVERHTVTLFNNLLAVRDSFRQLVNAADGARANLPKHINGHHREGIEGQLSPDQLRFLAECAAYGQSQGGIAAPGCTRAPPNAHTIDQFSGQWPGLIELVSSRVIQPLKNLLDPKPAVLPEIVPVASSAGTDARPTDASPQTLAPVAAAALIHGVRPPSLTGVVIRNGSMTNSTERMPAPEPYQETPGAPVDEPEGEEAINDAPEEITAPAPFQAPPYEEVY